MPIIIQDFKWRQTESLIIIQVPLRGIHQSKVDVFTSSRYIKASFKQFFFEVFLLHPIIKVKSKCTISSIEITFELLKEELLHWEQLELEIPKSEKLELKQKYIEEEYKLLQHETKEKFERKCELKRVSVRQQIELDTKQRNTIDKIKNDEKINALGDLREWQNKTTTPKIVEIFSDDEEDDTILEPLPPKKVVIRPTVKKINNSFKSNAITPFPRKSATLEVDFTTRQFPTPSRESQLEEENEWLRKQAEVRRSIGFVSEDLRPEEKNPQYLLSKGTEFFKSGNYLGAISAFSFGIKISEKFSDLYIMRSKVHLQVGNYYRAVQDCSKALDLLQPVVSANFNDRVDCIIRRGQALCKMDMLREGISELESAYKLRSHDEDLKKMLCEAINKLNENCSN